MPQPLTVRHSGHFLPILTAIGALSLAACGSPDEDPPGTTASTDPNAPGSVSVGPTVGPGVGGGGTTAGPTTVSPTAVAPPVGGGGMGGGGAPSGMGGASGGPAADDTPVRSTTGPSYAATVEPIFAMTCTPSCHEPGGLLGGPGGLGQDGVYMDLSTGAGYAALTAERSKQLPTMWIVGNGLEDSYLWHKLEDTFTEIGGKGAKMPVTGELTDADMAAVQAWIEGGAAP